jgi:hypothetical protein
MANALSESYRIFLGCEAANKKWAMTVTVIAHY